MLPIVMLALTAAGLAQDFAPFYLTFTETNAIDKQVISDSGEMYTARRANGDRTSGPVDPQSRTTRWLILGGSKEALTISDSLRLVSTERIGGLLPPARDCNGALPPGAQRESDRMAMNLQLLGATQTQVSPDGSTVRVTRWLAPALNCWEVERVAIRTLPNGREEINRIQLKTVLSGEPDAALFVRPTGYREVPPSELAAGLAGAAGRAMPDRVAESLRRLDGRYQANQTKPR